MNVEIAFVTWRGSYGLGLSIFKRENCGVQIIVGIEGRYCRTCVKVSGNITQSSMILCTFVRT